MTTGEMMAIGLGIGGPAISGLIWAIRLEGRINTHEQVCGERYKNLAERHDATTEKLKAIDDKLDRLVSR